MKRSLFCLALLFSVNTAVLSAQYRNLEFFLSGSRNSQALENKLHYDVLTSPNSMVSIRGASGTEKRLSFNQNSKHTMLDIDLNLYGRVLRHSFSSGFEYLYDHSDLELELTPYVNKTGSVGYALEIAPSDSASLSIGVRGLTRNEQDRYSSERKLLSDGYILYSNGRFGVDWDLAQAGVLARLEQKRMNWERYDGGGVSAYINLATTSLFMQNNFVFDYRQDALYTLNPSPDSHNRGFYELNDTQTRNMLSYNTYLDYTPGSNMMIRARESFFKRVTDFDSNIVRSNADYLNQAELLINTQASDGVNLEVSASHIYAIKDFNFNRNTRHTDTRNLRGSFAWEYSPGDTLQASSSIELQRTTFPDDNRWDNDLLNRTMRLGITHYLHHRVKLQAWSAWNIRDDVYINSVLSSNNKQVNSISFQPECSILLGDRLLFRQSYAIRADYTEFAFEGNTDTLYRQLAYKYNLVFDTFPYVARSGDLIWMQLPYRRNHNNAFMADLYLSFEQNEYAEEKESYYYMGTQHKRYVSGVVLKHDIGNLYYIVEPRVSWGTWKEYSLLLGMAWRFNNQSLLELSVNPLGENFRDPDWRTTLSVNLQF